MSGEKRKRKICEEEKRRRRKRNRKRGITVQVCGNLRQPQWAIKQMGNLVMPIKGWCREGKHREMKQNVILMHEMWNRHPHLHDLHH